MALFNYKCVCGKIRSRIVNSVSLNDLVVCACGKLMVREFPLKGHVQGENKEIDGADLGKVTKEKNEVLKKKHSGYSYEEQNLRKQMSEKANEKLKKEKI